MSVPIVVLNRDTRLDQLYLKGPANGIQQSSQVEEKRVRGAKVDSEAFGCHQACSDSGLTASRRRHRGRLRKRRKLAVSFKTDVSRQATVVDKSNRALAEAGDVNANVSPPTLDSRSVRTSIDAYKPDGWDQPSSSVGSRQPEEISRGDFRCKPLLSKSSTSVPIVVLHKDHRLKQFYLKFSANGVQTSLQVGLEREAESDSLAFSDHQACPNFGVAISKRKRGRLSKRRKLAVSFKPEVRRQAAKMNRSDRVLTEACTLNVNPSTLDSRSVQTSNDACIQDGGGEQPSSLGGSRQAVIDDPDQDGSKLLPTSSNQPACSSNASEPEKISKEDFMALLCLSPSHVAARLRKCTRHRASKYFHIKSQNLWKKICRESNDDDYNRIAETTKKPCNVVLQKNEMIDSLALQSIPQSVHLDKVFKSSNTKKRLNKRRLINVVLERDSVIDRLALRNSDTVCTPSHSLPLADRKANDGSGNTVVKTLSVNICRDSNLDKLALQASNSVSDSLSLVSPGPSSSKVTVDRISKEPAPQDCSVKIKRDECVDRLAFQNPNAPLTGGPDCINISAPNCQPTPAPPIDQVSCSSTLATEERGDGRENQFHCGLKENRKMLPSLKGQNNPKSPASRNAVIRLKRFSCGEWAIIQPRVEVNRNDSAAQSSNIGGSESGSSLSQNAASDIAQNGHIASPAYTSSMSEDEFDHESHNIQSCAKQTRLQTPAFRSSARKRFLDLAPSTRSSRRAKPVVSEESLCKSHDENKNPRKQVVPPTTKIINSAAMVMPRGSRRNLCVSPKDIHSKVSRPRSTGNVGPVNPSVSRYMTIKKPLHVKSELNSLSPSTDGSSQADD